jgi:NAD(P)-dependent dehydrogenase (short-subunit alcohol dehydrogenase family)
VYVRSRNHARSAVKLTAMRRLCKAAISAMRARRWGRIVNMSSIGGIYPNPKLPSALQSVAPVIHETLQRLPCFWPQLAMTSSPETP